MQHRRMFVVGHDVVVGHFLLTLRAGGQIAMWASYSDAPRRNAASCGRMAAGTQYARPAHAFELVAGLYGPIEVQLREQIGGFTDCGSAAGKQSPGPMKATRPSLAQCTARTGRVRHWDDVDGRRPRLAEAGSPACAKNRWVDETEAGGATPGA